MVATVAPRCFASWIANVPTPPVPAWMKTFCPGFRFASFEQCLPGGEADERNGSRFFHAEFSRFDRHVGFVHGDEFREGADPVLVRSRIDLVTGLEAPPPCSHLDHNAGDVVTENKWKSVRQEDFEFSVRDLCRSEIDAAAWIWTSTSLSPTCGCGMSTIRPPCLLL